MRTRDIPRVALNEVIAYAAKKEHDKMFSLRIRGLVNQVKCGKLPVSVLDEIERDYPDKWKMIAAARREVLGDA